MNELIAKLYDQAIILEGNGDYVTGELDPVKFAELIVAECAGIYCKIDHGNQHMGTDDYLEALQKTFYGVEEC